MTEHKQIEEEAGNIGSWDTGLAISLLLVGAGGLPVKPLLVKFNHKLRALDICHPRGHQVGQVAPPPHDQEEQLSPHVGGAYYTLRSQTPGKATLSVSGVNHHSVLIGVRHGGGPQFPA